MFLHDLFRHDVISNQTRTDDVLPAKFDAIEILHLLDDLHELQDSTLVVLLLQIRLIVIATHDEATAVTETSDDGIEFVEREVLHLVDDDDGISQSDTTHEGCGQELDLFLGDQFIGFLTQEVPSG